MNFLDFKLKISQGDGVSYTIYVDSPSGEATAQMTTKIDDHNFRCQIEAIRQHSRGMTRDSIESNRAAVPASQVLGNIPDSIKSIGHELFKALMSREVESLFRRSLDKAKAENKGLRVRLQIDPAKLAAIPWEYLFDAQRDDHLCLIPDTPLVRYIAYSDPALQLRVVPPLKILGMIASPANLPQLDVTKEKRDMQDAIQGATNDGLISLSWVEGQTWRDLMAAMDGSSWNVFHFIGHGGFDPQLQEGYLALTGEDGKAYHCKATALKRIIAKNGSLRLVVLNSCEGARASENGLFSSAAAVLIKGGIPAVVSMQDKISDLAAIEFSRAFYTGLANGKTVDEALTAARIIMLMAKQTTAEWATPVLHMHAADTQLFNIDVKSAIFRKLPPKTLSNASSNSLVGACPAQVVSAGRLPSNSATEEAPAVLTTAVFDTSASDLRDYSEGPDELRSEDAEQLWKLADKVKQTWIAGLLEKSTCTAELMELGLYSVPASGRSRCGSVSLESSESIYEFFEQTNRSMLILGQPGSGKTTFMLRLVERLLSKATGKPLTAVPVVLSLTSWRGSCQRIEDWMTDELRRFYEVPAASSKRLLQQKRLHMFLDGLDELSQERRVACVVALNELILYSAPKSLTVCCRFTEYTQLPEELWLDFAVHLRDVSQDQVLMHLTSHRLGPLHDILRGDSALFELAQKPLMLNMMSRAAAYLRKHTPEEHTNNTTEARQQQVIRAFIEHRFRASRMNAFRTGEQDKHIEQWTAWLVFLARNMKAKEQTNFVVEQIQPSWLNSAFERAIYVFTTRLFAGVWYGFGLAAHGSIGYSLNFIPRAVTGAAVNDSVYQFMSLAMQNGIVCGLTVASWDFLAGRCWHSGPFPLNGPPLLKSMVIIGTGFLVSDAIFVVLHYFWGTDLNSYSMKLLLTIMVLFYPIRVLNWGTRNSTRSIGNDIQPVETLSWSWRWGAGGFLSSWIALGLIGGAINSLVLGKESDLWHFSAVALFAMALAYPLALALGFNCGEDSHKTHVNQGVRQSFHNAILSALMAFALVGITVGGFAWLLSSSNATFDGLCWGCGVALWSFGYFGGFEAVFHYILRSILFVSGKMPFRIARFLDYATDELKFMRKVGGGYIFIHRLLLEHFSNMESNHKGVDLGGRKF